MIITTKSLYSDTINFLKFKWYHISIFIFLSSLLTVIIDIILTPNINFLSSFHISKLQEHFSLFDFINTLTFKQKKLLLLTLISKMLSLLVGNAFLLGNLILYIKNISIKNTVKISILKNIFQISFNRIFLLVFNLTLIIQIGFMLFIFPGILLLIILSLSPIIFLVENQTILNSFFSSIKISINYYKIISPAIIIWLISKFFIFLIFSHIIFLNEYLSFFLLNFCMNIISSFLIVYLFRFYMLISNLKTSQSKNNF